MALFSVALFGVLLWGSSVAPAEAATVKRGLLGGEDDGECSDLDKQKYDTLYCTAYVCTGCCSDWCKEKCDEWKKEMDDSNCACDTEPEAHTSSSFCEDEADDFHEEWKDDPWE